MYITSLISPGALACLLALLAPMTSFAQSCKPESIPATTPTSQFIDHGDGTVTDTKTGLMWKRCTEGQVWNDSTCNDTSESVTFFTWQGALQQAQAMNSTGGFAGQVDWRVPNPKELTSLLEDQCFEPAINITVFPTTHTLLYWSSSSSVNDSNFAWSMADDGVFWSLKSSNLRVRLVRGGGAQSKVLEDFESYPIGDWQNGNSNFYGEWLSCDTICDRMQITEDGWFDHVYERGSVTSMFKFSTSTGLFSGKGIERVSWDVVLSNEGWYPGGEWVVDWNQVTYYIVNGGYGGDHSDGVYAGFCQSADTEGEFQFYILDNGVSNNCSGQVKIEGAKFYPNRLYTVTVEIDNDHDLFRASVDGQWTNWIPSSTPGVRGIRSVVFTPLRGHKYDNIRGGSGL